MVNVHTVAVMAAIAVIVATIGYSAVVAYSASELQIRWHDQGSFDYLSTMFGGKLSICNNSDLPANLKSYSIKMTYDGESLGVLQTDGANIAPHSTVALAAKFSSTDKRISEMFFSFLDTEMGGTDVTRIDSKKMNVETTIESSIIGFIPVSFSTEYSGEQFVQIMNRQTGCDI